MTSPFSVSRRRFLAVAAISSTAVLLGGCTGSASSSPTAKSSPPAPPPSAAASAGASAKPAVAASPSAAPSAAGKLALRVAYPAISGVQTPLWIAADQQLFAQRGVDVSLKFIAGTVAVSSLIAKDVDVLMEAATAMLTADLNGKANLVYVASAYNHAQFSLMVAPSIKTPDDLKGKLLGTDRAGTTTDYFARLLLRLVGLKPTDVQQRPLGGSTVLLPALLSGEIQAAPIAPPATFQAEAAGFHSLKDTYDQPYQNVGAVIHRDRIAELTPALVPFLTAYRQGMQIYTKQPDEAKRMLQKYGKVSDPATLEKTYEFYIKQTQFQLDLEPTTQGIQYMLDFLSGSIPAAKTAKPDQFIDGSVLKQLPKE